MSESVSVCLFEATEVKAVGEMEQIVLQARYDEDNPRDQSFSKYTPWGEMHFNVNNPNVMGKIGKGKKYYITITPADEDDAG